MTASRGKLPSSKITTELAKAFSNAGRLMRQRKQEVLSPEMLLLALATTPESAAYQLLRHLSSNNGFRWDEFVTDIDRAAANKRTLRDQQADFVPDGEPPISLGEELLVVLDEGLLLAESSSEPRCSSMHALVYLADIQVSTHWLLEKRGIYPQTVRNALERAAGSQSSDPPSAGRRSSIYHRVDLETKLVNLLSLKSERNVILIGSVGTGRRSLVMGVAELMSQGKGPLGLSLVVELDEKELLGNATREVERGLRRAQGGILFVPDIDRFFGGLRSEFGEEAGNLLQRVFLTKDTVIIGTATEESYSKKLRTVRVITEHSQILRVPPASVEETTEILRVVKPRFEADYKLRVTDGSLADAARLAGRYYTVKPLPGAAVDLLHRACAMVKANRRIGDTAEVKDDQQLDSDDVMITASMLTGIPVNSMGADERNRYINMVFHLQQRIIGQEMAVMALSRAVKMARVGLKDPKRPIGSFLFLGPTGVGKSELAKALAEFMFGTERALITLDMSEYMEASSVNRLIGSPPGYVGHESGGQLTDTIKKQPYSVVLFDEVEKADRKVFDTLLQVMDEGRLTSGQGETVSFSECVILMTSNIGGEHLADVRLSQNMASETNPDGEVDPIYYLDNIHQLLESGFGDDELLALFGADPTFALDDDLLRTNPDKDSIIDHIITQAEQKSQFDLLLQLAESFNPAKFEACQPYFNWAVACRRAEAALKSHFRPEFLNRLDDIIYFHPLNEEHLRKILDLMLKKEESLLMSQQLKLEVNDKAKSWLLNQNEHPEWGARPLRRLLQRHIRERLAEFILVESPPPGSIMRVQEKNGQLKITRVKSKKA